MCGTLVSGIPLYVEGAITCENAPAFHTIHLKRLRDCFNQSDKLLSERLDATNDIFFSEIQRLDKEIDDATRK